MTRFVEIAAGATWTAEVGAGFLVLVADMRRAGLGVTRIEIANNAYDALDRLLNEPAGASLSPLGDTLTCDKCRFLAPLLYDEPDGRRLCAKCKAPVSDRPRSRESLCRSRWLPDLRDQVLRSASAWDAARASSALLPDRVSEREALRLLDALTGEGVLRREVNGSPRWVRPFDPCDPAGGAA